MASDPGSAPKIIVDDDWKSQAQAEKERLQEVEAKAQASQAGGPAEGELPPADFASLVGMLVTQALMYLGGVPDRRTGQGIFDPDMARFYIDLLAVLEQKTKGNVSEIEAKELASAVHELRLRFVEISQLVAKQIAAQKGAGSPGAAGGPGGPIGPGGAGGTPMIHVG